MHTQKDIVTTREGVRTMTDIVERLRDRACPAGLPHTGDNPRDDHGHTDCWLHHLAADEIERLRAELGHTHGKRA